eukprot:6487454-Amphidinium_carterae.1
MVSSSSSSRSRMLALPASSKCADSDFQHSSLLVTPECGPVDMAPGMVPDPIPRAHPEGTTTSSVSTSGPAASLDLAQLHVSLLHVVNQAITNTLQPVLAQHQHQLERIDDGQKVLQPKMSDGLASLSTSLSKHGSRLSALEEAQRSLSQRLQKLEVHQPDSVPT